MNMPVLAVARGAKNVLKPYGETEVLLYYAAVAKKLRAFLRGKEIATKNWLPVANMPFVIRRGSKEEPLYAEDFAAVTPEFLKLRRLGLGEARPNLSKKQELIWRYFVPRKLSDFFYATNNEGVGKPIERIFIDLDRGAGMKPEQSQVVCNALFRLMQDDMKALLGYKPKNLVCWTGSSFHIFFLLKKPKPQSFYEKHFQYSKNRKPSKATLLESWIDKLRKDKSLAKIRLEGGHDKLPARIVIDPSCTPSGKLTRSPFSLHMKDARTVDGVDIPLKPDMLGDRKIIAHLRAYTPNKVIDELASLAKRLP